MAEKMVEEFLLTDDECYKACEDAHLSPFATPYQERAVFLRAQVRKAYPIIDSLAYCRGYNEATAEARQQAYKTILDDIEKHCTEYQWTETPDYTKRHYPFCPTDLYELKVKYLGELPKE